MRCYNVGLVTRLLRNYLYFRSYLHGQSQRINDIYAVTPKARAQGDAPLGQRAGDPRPWPFAGREHARPPRVSRYDLLEEIHVAMLDLERGLRTLDDDDVYLLYAFHVFQTKTLDELCAERKVTRSAMSRRIHRAVRRLTRAMERGA